MYMKNIKKIVSVLLCVLLLGASVSMIAFAEDAYTQAYTVRVADDCKKMIEIEPMGDSNSVPKGDSFRFGIRYLGSYRPDESTVIKAYPASYPFDLYYQDDDTTASYTLVPDEYGIYTIENVQEDWYVAVYSLSEGQISNVKGLLFNFLNAFLQLLRRIFGVA